MLTSLKEEPVVALGAAGGIVGAIVLVVASFVHLDQDQINAMGALLLVAGPPVLAFIQRQFVSPIWRRATPANTVHGGTVPPE